MANLFQKNYEKRLPIAYRLRPKKLKDFIGQKNILNEEKVLYKLIKNKKIVNSIFYGPPGIGKTSLAEILSNELQMYFEKLNATNASTSDIKEVVKKAGNRLKIEGKQTILFLDEIHRFNKLQQDSLLPSTESGIIILIGATTENPYYNLNNSLLSRCMVFKFEKLNDSEVVELLKNGLKELELIVSEEIIEYIVSLSDGDARRALNYLDVLLSIDLDLNINNVKEVIGKQGLSFDKKDDKYNTISAFIKSIRGSDPDASIYWLAKMLEGGEDPKYIARRLMILAAEDIGLANPDALLMANSALMASKEIGMPEVRIILSEVTIYLAISSKSNSAYIAINDAMQDIKNELVLDVPQHLTSIGKSKYKYPHSYEGNFVKQKYFSGDKSYYNPSDNKNENLIKEKLKRLWEELE